MAFSEFEIKRITHYAERFLERRRPAQEIRDELDFGYRIQGESVEIVEIRPLWSNPSKRIEEGLVRATTYVKSRKLWKVYWQRADLKRYRCDPKPEVLYIEDFLELVAEDAHCCFLVEVVRAIQRRVYSESVYS